MPEEEEQQGPPLEIITNEPTEAQQLIGMDSTTTPTILKPINDIPPPKHLEDVVGGGEEKTGAEQSDEAIRLMREALNPTKAAEEGGGAEDGGPEGGGGNTNKPPYTKDEINNMTVSQLGELISANDITDDVGRPLIYNAGKKRVFSATNAGKQIDKPDLRSFVYAHYGL